MNIILLKNKLIKLLDLKFKPRWEVYEELVLREFNDKKNWIDAGCGTNAFVREYKYLVNNAVGIDATQAENPDNFILSSIHSLPFDSGFADIVTLRFVVEHLEKIEADFKEIHRVLKPGGKVFCITTNLLCPFILISKAMPDSIKQPFIRKVFKVKEEDIFPTFHKLNTYYSWGVLKINLLKNE